MTIHTGNLTCPGEIAFIHKGYWHVYTTVQGREVRDYIPYSEPRKSTRSIRKMYGFSIRGFFIGVILYDKPKETRK